MENAHAKKARIRTVLAILAGFTIVGLFFASRTYLLYNSYPENDISWGRALAPALLDWYMWAAMFPLIYWIASRFPFEKGSLRRAVAAHVIGMLSVGTAKVALDNYVALPVLGSNPVPFVTQLQRGLHPNIVTYALLVAAIHLVSYYRKFRERELRTVQLEARLAQTRLQVLRMQLHPHFLFNTLNAISTLMHRDVDAAEQMLTRLSDLLRMTLDQLGGQEVALREELEFVRLYAEIEQMRFADRLQVKIDAPSDTLDALVPHFTLQPLVENAIRHGIAPRSTPGTVEIEAHRGDGTLELRVRDDGVGMVGTEARNRKGLGLANTRARLAQLYGQAHSLSIVERSCGGVEVVLCFPYRSVRGNSDGLERSSSDEESEG